MSVPAGMGGKASKEVATAAFKEASKHAGAASRASPATSSSSSSAVAAPPIKDQVEAAVMEWPPVPAPSPHLPPGLPSLPAVPDMDPKLIKAINDMGPVIKTMRSAPPTQAGTIKLVDPHSGHINEGALVQVLGVCRESSFSVEKVAKEHGVSPEELKKAMKYLYIPRIIEKKGGLEKIGVFP